MIEGDCLLSEIHRRGKGDYADLAEEYGEKIVCIGAELVDISRMLYKIVEYKLSVK